MYFTPSRDDGLRRLKDFIPAAGIKYAQGRNYDRGADAHKSVSQLSPYIRRRTINEVEVLKSVLGAHSPCLLYTSPSPRDGLLSRMPSSA